MNVNPSYRPVELRYALNKVGVKALVAARSFRNQNYVSILKEAIPEFAESGDNGSVHSREVPSLKSLIMIGEEHVK